jgi:pyruvate/2-oxoglutarate dehydrogenase complex dihydrolipoamide acyltransferase (E2) component
MSTVEVKVPNIGDFKEVEIIELMIKVGDTIKVDQSLVTVESDKASMEIPSTHAGVVKELKVKVGDKVGEGSLLLPLPAFLLQMPRPRPLRPASAAASLRPPCRPL